MQNDRNFSRRDLMRLGARLGIGGAGLMALRDLQILPSLAAQPMTGDYKALVCVFLFGGNDSYNLVVPSSSTEYDVYHTSRQNLAVDRASLLPITPLTSDGATYGFHPSCAALQTLFQSGKLGVIANVGSLVGPLTKAQYQLGGPAVPPQLFSHSDQQFQWQTGIANTVDNVGWCGRVADVSSALNVGSEVAMNISLAGSNTLQVGHNSLPYNLGVNGPIELDGLFQSWNVQRTLAFQSLLDHAHTHRMVRQFAGVQQQAIDLQALISDALDNGPTLTTTFPNSGLAKQLKMVARAISIRSTLGASRQIFFVSTGGFDTHDNQNQDQPNLFANISASLAAFQAALEEIGASTSTTLFTASDFGRTLTSNGDGSDHGWGGHHLVMGGAVRGHDIYGQMPNFAINGPDDADGGRIIPTTSIDEYSATLAKWFGVGPSDLATVFPNLGHFAHPDLGFMT